MSLLSVILLLLLSAVSLPPLNGYQLYFGAYVRDGYTGVDISSARITITDSIGAVLCDSVPCITDPYNAAPGRYFYSIQIPVDSIERQVAVNVAAPDYEPQTFVGPYHYWINDSTAAIYFDEIELFHSAATKKLDEVTVTASKVKMVMKGDTLVYDATAFRMADGSMLDGLIRALPGAELNDNGQISVNGKFVSELLVNGREFFKGDPKVALANLPAYTVKNIKVYGKKDDYIAEHKENLVMDVNLKREYAKGIISNYEIGGGTGLDGTWNIKWLGRFFAMRYTPVQSLAIYANANNLNAEHHPGRRGEWSKTDIASGQQTTKSAGVNFFQQWKESKSEINTSLNVTRRNIRRGEVSWSEAYLNDGNVFNRNNNSVKSDATLLEWNGNFKQQLKNVNYSLNSRAYYEHNAAKTELKAVESDDIGEITYSRHKQESARRNMWGMSVQCRTYLNFNDNVSAQFRNWNININGRYNGSALNRQTGDIISYPRGLSANLNQLYNEKLPERSCGLNLEAFSLRLPFGIGEKSMCSYNIGYLVGYNHQSGRREMEYRHDIPGADDLWLRDLQNSYFTTENSLSNKLDFSGNIHGPVNVDLHLTGNFLTRQVNDRRIYFQSLHKSNFLLDGVMTLTYGANAWEDGANYKLNVSYSEDAPKMLNLLTIADNSNPLFHTLGNPSLTKSSRYAAEIAFSHNRTAGKRKIDLYAGYSCVDRAVTIARFYNRRTGITTMSPQNINGNFEVSVNADYSRFIGRNDCLFLSNTFRGELLRSADYSSDSEN